MGWQNDPQITAARDYGKRFNWQAVIILSFDNSERYSLVTWGKDKKLCDATKKVGNSIAMCLADCSINCAPVTDILNPIEELEKGQGVLW